jgi:hypothetical protein
VDEVLFHLETHAFSALSFALTFALSLFLLTLSLGFGDC